MKVGVFGATGLIGRTFLKILEEENVDSDLYLFASKKSKGKKLFVNNKEYIINVIDDDVFNFLDVAFFFMPSNISEQTYKRINNKHLIVIDNSSFFRMLDDVPLIIPEINKELINNQHLIANPNCTTIQALLSLYPLHQLFKIQEIAYTTYQSLSGAGKYALEDKYPFESVMPLIGELKRDGYSSEERKMILETKKILSCDIKVHATCVRVLSPFVHGADIDVIFESKVNLQQAKNALLNSPRLNYQEEFDNISQKGRNDVLITRLRIDKNNPRRLHFFTFADNLRVGASYNSFMIAKYLKIF